MKVESILIKNFKRFEHLEVSFKNQTLNAVSNRFLVLGDNGIIIRENCELMTNRQVAKIAKGRKH
jgi:hypothetical protein